MTCVAHGGDLKISMHNPQYSLPPRKDGAPDVAGLVGKNGMLTVITTVFLANTVDYGELKNDRRDESVIFSMQTFTVKLASGIAAFLSGLAIDWIGLVTEAGAEQTASATGLVREARQRLDSRLDLRAGGPSVLRSIPLFTAKDVMVSVLWSTLSDRWGWPSSP